MTVLPPLGTSLKVVRIKLGDDRPAPQPDPLGRARIGYTPGLSAAELWDRGRGAWKAKLPSLAESELVVFASGGVVVLVGSITGVEFVGDRVAINGRPDAAHPLIGSADPLHNDSRNPIAYGSLVTVPPNVSPRSWDEVFGDAVAALTEAARLRRPALRAAVGGGWEPDPTRTEQADWAEFVTLALAASAANVGGVDAALAGRPGSWEAAGVEALLHSTVGDDESDLWRHRTEPLTVRVRLPQVIGDYTDAWSGYWDAEAEIDRREEAALDPIGSDLDEELCWFYTIPEEGEPIAQSPDAPTWSWTSWREWLAQDGYSDADIDSAAASAREWRESSRLMLPKSAEAAAEIDRRSALRSEVSTKYEALRDRLDGQRRQEWNAYGAALKARIEASASALSGLAVPVNVIIESESESESEGITTQNPHYTSLEARLLEAAAEETPSPDTLPGTPLERLGE